MTAGRRIAGAATVALAALAIAAASHAPWSASPADRALLRLSWRAPSEIAEQCRPLTEEEKADLPVHMQVPEVCETRAIPYLLEVRIDGGLYAADTIHGAGAREDRPITVFREIPVASGRHAIDVAFRPLVQDEDEAHGDEDEDEEGEEEDEDEEDEGEDDESGEGDDDAAVSLAYSEALSLGPREVALIAFDPARRALVRIASP